MLTMDISMASMDLKSTSLGHVRVLSSSGFVPPLCLELSHSPILDCFPLAPNYYGHARLLYADERVCITLHFLTSLAAMAEIP